MSDLAKLRILERIDRDQPTECATKTERDAWWSAKKYKAKQPDIGKKLQLGYKNDYSGLAAKQSQTFYNGYVYKGK